VNDKSLLQTAGQSQMSSLECSSKTIFSGKIAIIQNRGSQFQQIVIGIKDLKQLYYDHRSTYQNVGELVKNLKQIVMQENGTDFMPGIMVLPEGSEIQVNKGQLQKLEDS